MDRKKARKNNKPARERPSGGSSRGGGFFHFFGSRPVRGFILTAVFVVLLVVFQESLGNFFQELRNLFGWGVLFILTAIIILITLAWRRSLANLAHHWNRWLGGIILVFAVWGILGLIDYNDSLMRDGLGGKFGYALVGSPSPGDSLDTFWGFFRVLGLIILGVVLVIPRLTLEAIKRLYFWAYDKIKGTPVPAKSTRVVQPGHRVMQPKIPGEKSSPPLILGGDEMPPEVASSRRRLEDLAEKAEAIKAAAERPPEPVPARHGLKQVAADVWKKYGQSPDLVEIDGWRLPPTDILDTSPEVQFSQADNLQRANLIEETLASYGVDAKVVQINAGPTVTQFGVEPGWDRKFREVKEKDRDGKVEVRQEEVSKTRVKVERINSLSNDLALALAAPTIRIEAPVPGKTFVGVEVPNTTSDLVSLRGVLETSNFQKLEAKTRMALALGKGAGGEAVTGDLTKMPHLLVAGATGSGKTVCLNTILCCLLMYNTPNDVRFILIDPKRVELTQYNSIPHLATPVIVDTTKAIAALRWLLEEMDQRYKKLAAAGARHIEGYNKGKTGTDKLPYLVLIVDELADLMMAGFDEVETSLCRLAQLSRATGIHLVVATQRPSVDVVTGLIKANFPTRISFAVTSQVDSRTILDGAGAEKLLGRGDMLYMPTEAAKPKRLQGCFLSDTEIDRLVYFWGSQQKEEPDKLRMETLVATAPSGQIGGFARDPLLEQAKELSRQYSDVSTSFLQRKLHIGYPRAARLKDQLDAVLSQEAGSAKAEAPTAEQEEEEDII
jgi:DNA segregation ATPase FtsK/SpoIIIE, S-DNA-T family